MAHATHSMHGYDVAGRRAALCAVHRPVVAESNGRRRRESRIANAILEAARSEAACLGGARLLRIGVNVGVDCDIDAEVLICALKISCLGTDLEQIVLHVIPCARRTVCRHCGIEVDPSANARECSECASPELEVLGGDELELAFIEVERA